MNQALITSPTLINYVIDELTGYKSESQWRSMMENARPYFARARTKLRGLFAEQLDEAMGYLDSQKAISADDAIDWDKWIVQFDEFGQLLLTDIIAEWGPEILGRITIGISFDIDFPFIQEFIKDHSYRMAVNVNETTLKQIRDLFTQATLDVDSVPQIQRNIRALFDGISKDRANMIARSEVIRAHNAGAEASYLQSGVVNFKQWWASKGERRTCQFCNDLHGRIIPVGTTYFNQGDVYEIMDAEGITHRLNLNYEDVRFPPLHPRCRCTLIPVVD